jgi:pimeloyl-ACP methyl ester carboxylesterase
MKPPEWRLTETPDSPGGQRKPEWSSLTTYSFPTQAMVGYRNQPEPRTRTLDTAVESSPGFLVSVPMTWRFVREGGLHVRDVIPAYDVRPRLAEITTPTLVLGGRHDWVTPYGESEIIAAGIPNSELVIFEESGHLPFVEEPDRFMQVVRRFMGFDQAA